MHDLSARPSPFVLSQRWPLVFAMQCQYITKITIGLSPHSSLLSCLVLLPCLPQTALLLQLQVWEPLDFGLVQAVDNGILTFIYVDFLYLPLVFEADLPDSHTATLLQVRPGSVYDRHVILLVSCQRSARKMRLQYHRASSLQSNLPSSTAHSPRGLRSVSHPKFGPLVVGNRCARWTGCRRGTSCPFQQWSWREVAARAYPAQENMSVEALTPGVRSKRTTHLPRAHALLSPHLHGVSAMARSRFQVEFGRLSNLSFPT